MAKAKPTGSAPGAERHLIKFRCLQCGSTLKVPVAQAERYIQCPHCKNKTQVPKNQKIADEEAAGYGVNKLAYDLTGTCRGCGAKMAKNAIICVKCGYDYRLGKNLEVVDKTKLPADFPTWNKMFAAMGGDPVVKSSIKVASAFMIAGVIVGIVGLGILYAIMWFVANEWDRPPIWPWYITFGISVIAFFAMIGMIQEALVESAAKGLYGRAISAGSIPVAALYFLATAIPAYALATLAICFLVFHISGAPEELPPGVEKGIINQGPLPVFTWNAEGGIVGLIVATFLTAVGHVYYFFGIGSYAADLSVNPANIFKWIGKCISDVFFWLGISMTLTIISFAIPTAVMYYGITNEITFTYVFLLWMFLQVGLLSYTLAMSAHMAGQIVKRHL